MKSNYKTFVVAVMVFIAATSDVVSQRRAIDCSINVVNNIDYCSKDSTFLVTIDVGSLTTADSVLLYDITLKYPATKLQFLQVLYQNTLSEALETKSYGSRDTGEIRVYGFNVFRFISGSKPLVALLFKHKAECIDSLVVSFASLPEFNQEAKVYPRDLRSAVVPILIPFVASRSLKFQFSNRTIVLPEKENRFVSRLGWSVASPRGIRDLNITFTLSDSLIIDSVATSASVTASIKSQQTSANLQLLPRSSFLTANDSIELYMTTARESSSGFSDVVKISAARWDTCSCVSAGVFDSVVVVRAPVSSVSNDVNSFVIRSDSGVWELNNKTGADAAVQIADLQGQIVWSSFVRISESVILQTDTFPAGVFFVRASTASGPVFQKLKVCK